MLLAAGSVVIAAARAAVKEALGYTCSAGIAHSKILAKLGSGLHKPAQQTIVPGVFVYYVCVRDVCLLMCWGVLVLVFMHKGCVAVGDVCLVQVLPCLDISVSPATPSLLFLFPPLCPATQHTTPLPPPFHCSACCCGPAGAPTPHQAAEAGGQVWAGGDGGAECDNCGRAGECERRSSFGGGSCFC